jgi:hypothetical protein
MPGYCTEANLTCPGPDRLIVVGKRRNLGKAAATASGGGTAGEPVGFVSYPCSGRPRIEASRTSAVCATAMSWPRSARAEAI